MRQRWSKFIKSFSIIAAIIFLIVGVLVSLLQLSFPFIIKHYKSELEILVSQQLHQPIQVASLATGWHGMTLILKLEDVLLINTQDANSSLRVRELKVGINPWSALLNRQLLPSVLVLNGTHLIFHQTDNTIKLEGVNLPTPTQTPNTSALESLKWLFAIRHLVLQDIDIDWYDKNGERFALDNVNAEMLNKAHVHRLWGKLTGVNEQQLAENDSVTKLRNARLGIRSLASKNPPLVPILRPKVVDGQIRLIPTISSMTLSKEPFLNISDAISIRAAAIPVSLSFNVEARGDWQHPNKLITKAYIKTENLALSQWSNKLAFLDLQDSKGLVNSEVWTEWQGLQLQQLKSVFNVEKFHLTQAKTVVGLQTGKGNLFWTHEPNMHACPKINYLGVQKPTTCHTSNNQVALAIDAKEVEFNHNQLFAKVLNLDHVQAHLLWRQQAEQTLLKVPDFSLLARGIKLQGQMQLTHQEGHSPQMRLLAGISGADAKHLADYLPIGILKPSLTHWLQTAIKSGHSPYASVLLHGPLASYPFGRYDGVFVIQAKVRNATLQYMPNWPILEHINGNMVFDKQRMFISTTGETLGAKVNKAEAIINDLAAKDTILQINSNIQATLAQGQEFLNTSPLQRNVGKAFADMKMEGPIKLDLSLDIPLKREEAKVQVRGDLTLERAILDLTKWQLPVQNFSGLVHFTERSVSAQNLQASLFKQPLLLNMRTINQRSAEPITEVEIKGNIASNLLKQQLKLTSLTWLKGNTPYTAVLSLPHSARLTNSLKITSNLYGMAIDLPKPLGKLANEAIPTILDMDFLKTGQLDLEVNYGQQLAALIHFIKQREKLKLNQANIKLNSPIVSGEVMIPGDDREIRANLRHLYLTPSNSKDTLLNHIEASDLPPLNITIDDFRYGKRRLGRNHLITEPTDDGLDIRKLTVDIGPLLLNASGHWTDTAKLERTDLKGRIVSNNVTSALTTLGLPQLITASTGSVEFNLGWRGAPTDFSLANLDGNVDFQLAQGSIVDIGRSAAIKMNLGRMLNLLSLESFPHNLNFKFRDVTFRGFNFANVQGSFNINDGHAVTDNTQVRGPMAAVGIKGRLGLASQDYDMYITVAPHLSTGLPLVATLVGGPVVGALAWVANKVVSKGTEKIMTHTYHMTGSWKSPAVEKVGTEEEVEQDENE